MGRPSKTKEDWLRFVLRYDLKGKRKTDIWAVEREDTPGRPLGFIKWHGAWRKYCFFPEQGTLYDPNCLRQIADLCEDETMMRSSYRGQT